LHVHLSHCGADNAGKPQLPKNIPQIFELYPHSVLRVDVLLIAAFEEETSDAR